MSRPPAGGKKSSRRQDLPEGGRTRLERVLGQTGYSIRGRTGEKKKRTTVGRAPAAVRWCWKPSKCSQASLPENGAGLVSSKCSTREAWSDLFCSGRLHLCEFFARGVRFRRSRSHREQHRRKVQAKLNTHSHVCMQYINTYS